MHSAPLYSQARPSSLQPPPSVGVQLCNSLNKIVKQNEEVEDGSLLLEDRLAQAHTPTPTNANGALATADAEDETMVYLNGVRVPGSWRKAHSRVASTMSFIASKQRNPAARTRPQRVRQAARELALVRVVGAVVLPGGAGPRNVRSLALRSHLHELVSECVTGSSSSFEHAGVGGAR